MELEQDERAAERRAAEPEQRERDDREHAGEPGVERVEAGPRGATITFRPSGLANPAGLVAWIAQQQGSAKLRPDQKLVLLRDWEDTDQRIAGTRRTITKLAEIAQAAPRQAAS